MAPPCHVLEYGQILTVYQRYATFNLVVHFKRMFVCGGKEITERKRSFHQHYCKKVAREKEASEKQGNKGERDRQKAGGREKER